MNSINLLVLFWSNLEKQGKKKSYHIRHHQRFTVILQARHRLLQSWIERKVQPLSNNTITSDHHQVINNSLTLTSTSSDWSLRVSRLTPTFESTQQAHKRTQTHTHTHTCWHFFCSILFCSSVFFSLPKLTRNWSIQTDIVIHKQKGNGNAIIT